MNINTTKLNRDVHTAHVEEEVAHRIIAERVAEKLGISLDGENVTWLARTTTRDTSTGIRHDVKVEITVDHDKAPRAT